MRPNLAGNPLVAMNPDERRHGSAAMGISLDRVVPRQPAYPVEVGIVTGEVGQTVGLHDRANQRVTGHDTESTDLLWSAMARVPALHRHMLFVRGLGTRP